MLMIGNSMKFIGYFTIFLCFIVSFIEAQQIRIIYPDTAVFCFSGDTVELACEVSAFPAGGIVAWLLGESGIAQTGERVRFENVPEGRYFAHVSLKDSELKVIARDSILIDALHYDSIDILLSGSYGGPTGHYTPAYWINDSVHSGISGSTIIRKGSDIYLFGLAHGYWKNDQYIQTGIPNYSTDFPFDFRDFYFDFDVDSVTVAVGMQIGNDGIGRAFIWEGGENRILLDSFSTASVVTKYEGDTYVLGHRGYGDLVMWKNDIMSYVFPEDSLVEIMDFPAIPNEAAGISFTSAGEMYIFGTSRFRPSNQDFGIHVGFYFHNGTTTYFMADTLRKDPFEGENWAWTIELRSFTLLRDTVYAVGYSPIANLTFFLKNGVSHAWYDSTLSPDTPAHVYSVTQHRGHLFLFGRIFDNNNKKRFCYYRNGKRYDLILQVPKDGEFPDISCYNVADKPTGGTAVKPRGNNGPATGKVLEKSVFEIFRSGSIGFVARFNVLQSGVHTLEMLDLSGKVLRRIGLGKLRKGDHAVGVDTSGLADGAYVARLTGGRGQREAMFLITK